MNTNEDLRARLTLDSMLGEMLRHDADETHPRIKALQYAIAALARKEEGREAVGDVGMSILHRDDTTEVGDETAVFTHAFLERLASIAPARVKLYAHPAPHSGGEGDAEVARLRQALQDVADPIGYLRREAAAKGESLGGMAYSIANDLHFVKQIASRALATPTPQSGEAAPIAWRFRYFDKATRIGFWRYSEGEPQPSYETGDLGFEKQPLYAAPASPQAAGVSDAYRELMEVRAGLCTLGVMGPGETAAEALQRYVTRYTAAGAAPEGWVLVPREPTQAMLDANGDCPFPSGKQWLEDDARRTWDAMLAASPQPGAQEGAAHD